MEGRIDGQKISGKIIFGRYLKYSLYEIIPNLFPNDFVEVSITERNFSFNDFFFKIPILNLFSSNDFFKISNTNLFSFNYLYIYEEISLVIFESI